MSLLIVTLLVIVLLHLQIVNAEEDFLLTIFGDDYLAYKKKVWVERDKQIPVCREEQIHHQRARRTDAEPTDL